MEGMQEELDTNTPYIDSPVPERTRRLAGHIKERYDSEEFQAFWKPAKSAILRGDEFGIRTWTKERIGCEPDFVLRVYVGKKELGDSTPRETWALVDDRGEKLRGETRGEPDDLGIAVFSEKTKKYPRLKRALSQSDDPTLEIDRAIRIAGAESPHGYPLTLNAIEWRIERDNCWRGIKGTPGKDSHGLDKTVSLSELPEESEVFEDPHAEEDLIEARYREFLAHYASAKNPARLSPGELEVFRLALHLEHREIAEEIGRTENQVRQVKYRACKKVRKHAEIKKSA